MQKIAINIQKAFPDPSAAESESLENENGFILVLVLIMLLVLSILGATVLTSTTSDLRVAGNFRTAEEAFNNADGSIQFILSNFETGGFSAATGVLQPINFPAPGNLIANAITQYIGENRGLPGMSQNNTAYEFAVTVTGVGTGANNARIELEAGVVKIRYDSEGNTLYQNF